MNDFYLFMTVVVGGVLLEVVLYKLYSKFNHTLSHTKFTLGKFAYLIFFPMLAVFITALKSGTEVYMMFIFFAVVGLILEWMLGFSYEKIMGERLWTYHHLTIGKYTSFLTIPLWGLAGVMFWLLAKALL